MQARQLQLTFTSGRKAVMTQVAVKFASISQNDPFLVHSSGQMMKPLNLNAVSL